MMLSRYATCLHCGAVFIRANGACHRCGTADQPKRET